MTDQFDIRNSAFELRPVLANPPFIMSDWAGDRVRDGVRCQFGASPGGNAKFYD